MKDRYNNRNIYKFVCENIPANNTLRAVYHHSLHNIYKPKQSPSHTYVKFHMTVVPFIKRLFYSTELFQN